MTSMQEMQNGQEIRRGPYCITFCSLKVPEQVQ